MVWRGRGNFETNRAIAKQRGSLSIGKKWLEKSEACGARGRELLSGGHDGSLWGCFYLTTNTEVSYLFISARETREGWPPCWLLKLRGDSSSTSKRDPFIRWFVGLVVPVQEIFVLPWLLLSKRFLSCLGCFSRPSTNLFSSPYTISLHLSPSPSKLGRQSCHVACLLICVSDYCHHNLPSEKSDYSIDISCKVLAHSLHIESFCSLWHILSFSALQIQ